MEGTRFVAIDVETTGVDPSRDTITELAVVPLAGHDSWSSLVAPPIGDHLPSPQHRDAPAFAEVAAGFIDRICAGGVVVASHNVVFDLGFVARAMESCGAQLPALTTVDTRAAAAVLLADDGTLAELCELYGVPHPGGHTALSDATATAGLLAHLLAVAADHGLEHDWLPVVHHDGPALAACGLPEAAASPLVRDLRLWPPAVHRHRGAAGPVELLTLPPPGGDEFREMLRGLADEPDRDPASRARIEAVLRLDDASLLAELGRASGRNAPDDEDLLEQRVLDALAPAGGLVQLRLLEDLVGDVRGTAHEVDVVGRLFDSRMELLGLDDRVAALVGYLAEPTFEPDAARAAAAYLILDAVGDGRFDTADAVVAACPEALAVTDSSGTVTEQLARVPYSLLADDRPEAALAVAAWAWQLPVDVAARARLRGVHGHVLERTGDHRGALVALLDDWDHGVRSPLHADRLSLLATRSGDPDTARRVLLVALEKLTLTREEREKLSKRLARLG